MTQYLKIARLLTRRGGCTGSGKWSPDEDSMLSADYPNGSTKDLSEKLGRTIDAIWIRARKLGLKKTDAAKFEYKSRGGKNNSHNYFPSMHGMAHPGNRTYASWVAMKARCHDITHKSYAYYGGRGIVVSDEWRDSFAAFLRDMGERPPGMSLGRIDNQGGYRSGNCRWETMKQQQNNRRSNRLLTAFGRTQTMQQWADEFGVGHDTIGKRLDQMKWSVEDAVSIPVGVRTRWKNAYFGSPPLPR